MSQNRGALFAPRSRSIILGASFAVDGRFPKLTWLHRVDATSGRLLASVNAGYHDVWAWGETTNPDRILSLSEKRIWLQDAATLEPLLKCEERVPRISGRICGIESSDGGQWVALALGVAHGLAEFELASGKRRKVLPNRVCELARCDGHATCVLENGTVMRRSDGEWRTVGRFPEGAFAAAFDHASGAVVALSDVFRWDAEQPGNGGRGQPTRTLWSASLRDEWSPRPMALSWSPKQVGIVSGMAVVIGNSGAGRVWRVQVVPLDGRGPQPSVEMADPTFASNAGLLNIANIGPPGRDPAPGVAYGDVVFSVLDRSIWADC